MRKAIALLAAIALLVGSGYYLVFPKASAQARSRLDQVKARGKLICGVSGETVGFSFVDPTTSQIVGFDADFCRAVAAWVGVPQVEFVRLTSANRIPAVLSGSVDVVFRTTTVTWSRDEQVDFGPVTFYDGQRLLVKSASKIRGLDDLSGARICSQQGTTSERNITDQMRLRRFRFELITFDSPQAAFQGLVSGRCDVWTTDASQLTAFRATAPNPNEFMVVGQEFSDEPLAPILPENDSKWHDAVAYAVYGVVLAEELGIRQITAASESRLKEIKDANPIAKALLEANGGAMVRALKAVGNYGEIYNRYFGPGKKTHIPREGTRNALARNGGAITSRPFR
ncbi:MAG: transporter substrate-binding domain-containing protein [Armatimonadetes bacterium]|nr:transporter substrate-binding domain-containing protein [Armatimonadota bacterium]